MNILYYIAFGVLMAIVVAALRGPNMAPGIAAAGEAIGRAIAKLADEIGAANRQALDNAKAAERATPAPLRGWYRVRFRRGGDIQRPLDDIGGHVMTMRVGDVDFIRITSAAWLPFAEQPASLTDPRVAADDAIRGSVLRPLREVVEMFELSRQATDAIVAARTKEPGAGNHGA